MDENWWNVLTKACEFWSYFLESKRAKKVPSSGKSPCIPFYLTLCTAFRMRLNPIKNFWPCKKKTLKTVWLYWIKAPLWTWFYSKKQRSTESAASRTIHTQLYHPYINPKPSPPHQQHLLFQKSLGAHATPGFFPPKKCWKIPQYLGLILSWEEGQPRYTTLITPKFKIDTTNNNSSKLPLVLV